MFDVGPDCPKGMGSTFDGTCWPIVMYLQQANVPTQHAADNMHLPQRTNEYTAESRDKTAMPDTCYSTALPLLTKSQAKTIK